MDLKVYEIFVQDCVGDLTRTLLKNSESRPVYCAIPAKPVTVADIVTYDHFPSDIQTLPSDMQADWPQTKIYRQDICKTVIILLFFIHATN